MLPLCFGGGDGELLFVGFLQSYGKTYREQRAHSLFEELLLSILSQQKRLVPLLEGIFLLKQFNKLRPRDPGKPHLDQVSQG